MGIKPIEFLSMKYLFFTFFLFCAHLCMFAQTLPAVNINMIMQSANAFKSGSYHIVYRTVKTGKDTLSREADVCFKKISRDTMDPWFDITERNVPFRHFYNGNHYYLAALKDKTILDQDPDIIREAAYRGFRFTPYIVTPFMYAYPWKTLLRDKRELKACGDNLPVNGYICYKLCDMEMANDKQHFYNYTYYLRKSDNVLVIYRNLKLRRRVALRGI